MKCFTLLENRIYIIIGILYLVENQNYIIQEILIIIRKNLRMRIT